MFFLYALWMCGHELHNGFFFTVVSVPEYVREGRFDRFLVRPLDTLFQVLTVPQQIMPDGSDARDRHARSSPRALRAFTSISSSCCSSRWSSSGAR